MELLSVKYLSQDAKYLNGHISSKKLQYQEPDIAVKKDVEVNQQVAARLCIRCATVSYVNPKLDCQWRHYCWR